MKVNLKSDKDAKVAFVEQLEKNGFTEVGIIYLSRTDVYDRERIAFHKVLE